MLTEDTIFSLSIITVIVRNRFHDLGRAGDASGGGAAATIISLDKFIPPAATKVVHYAFLLLLVFSTSVYIYRAVISYVRTE